MERKKYIDSLHADAGMHGSDMSDNENASGVANPREAAVSTHYKMQSNPMQKSIFCFLAQRAEIATETAVSSISTATASVLNSVSGLSAANPLVKEWKKTALYITLLRRRSPPAPEFNDEVLVTKKRNVDNDRPLPANSSEIVEANIDEIDGIKCSYVEEDTQASIQDSHLSLSLRILFSLHVFQLIKVYIYVLK